MLSAVELDDQSFFKAYEINNVFTQRLLPSKFVAVDLPESKLAPKEPFSFGGTIAESARTQPYAVHTPYPNLSPQGGKESDHSDKLWN
jgi:hypothetical protein